MKIGQTIRRISPWGDVVTREIKDEKEIENYKDMQRQGFELEVFENDKWVAVPRPVTIHKDRPEVCLSCEG